MADWTNFNEAGISTSQVNEYLDDKCMCIPVGLISVNDIVFLFAMMVFLFITGLILVFA